MGERDRSTTPPDTGVAGKPEARKGNTTTAQGENRRPVPRMPHERDESADSQPKMDASHQRVGRAAQGDTERGVTDTTKGAELDAAYDRLREDVPDGEKKFRP